MERRLVKAETRRIPSDGGTLSLLILRPLRTGAAPVPGVLWLHGGGFQSGSARDVYLTRALSLVTKFGAVLVAPNYRLSRRHPYPAGLRDCYAALLYLKAHADELGVRSDQLMIGGESAGGGLTAALCMLARDRGEVNIAFQMPLYPMLDDRDTPSSVDNHSPNWNTKRNHRAWKRYLRGAYGTERVSCYAAPARCENLAGLPPCYTYVGELDPFYCEATDYVKRLREAGTEAEIDCYPGWFHAYDLFFPFKKTVREAVARFESRYRFAAEHYFAPQND